jgi:subtilisin family serine protease
MNNNMENYEHIDLPKYEGEFKKKGKQGYGINIKHRENKNKYVETQVFNLVREQDNLNEIKRKFSKYFDPNFIFKIKFEYEVIGKDGKEKKKTSIDNSVIKFLEDRGLKIISPSPEGNGYWVSIADDEELKELRKSLEKYALGICKYSQLDMIKEMFIPIPPEDKIGPRLKDNPLSEDEDAYLDVEIWRMDNERLNRFLWGGDDGKEGFNKCISKKGGRVTDTFITENLCLLRVKVNKELFEEILQLREICTIDRPPKPSIHYEMVNVPMDNIYIGGEPSENSTGIAILDSGIIRSHPLLKNAVGDATYVPLISNDKIKKPDDDVGHGTKVAGVALYGNLKECLEKKKFQPEVWIFSAKIMYNNGDYADFSHNELLEHQLDRAVRYFVENYPNCKVVNLSLGVLDEKMFNNPRQFPLATLIDELAKELDVIFVVSSGNFEYNHNGTCVSQLTKRYPNYLLDNIEDVKIINPASSAYAITVGAVSPSVGNSKSNNLLRPIINEDYPSMITRVGPGYKGMIKPELVEEGGTPLFHNGGNMDNLEGQIIVLNHDYISKGRLFTVDYGTSFSAPKVAHYLARLYNKYPNASPNATGQAANSISPSFKCSIAPCMSPSNNCSTGPITTDNIPNAFPANLTASPKPLNALDNPDTFGSFGMLSLGIFGSFKSIGSLILGIFFIDSFNPCQLNSPFKISLSASPILVPIAVCITEDIPPPIAPMSAPYCINPEPAAFDSSH